MSKPDKPQSRKVNGGSRMSELGKHLIGREALRGLDVNILIEVIFALDRMIKTISHNNVNLFERLPYAPDSEAAETLVAQWNEVNRLAAQSIDVEISRLVGGASGKPN
jgi:hypothetical protein